MRNPWCASPNGTWPVFLISDEVAESDAEGTNENIADAAVFDFLQEGRQQFQFQFQFIYL